MFGLPGTVGRLLEHLLDFRVAALLGIGLQLLGACLMTADEMPKVLKFLLVQLSHDKTPFFDFF